MTIEKLYALFKKSGWRWLLLLVFPLFLVIVFFPFNIRDVHSSDTDTVSNWIQGFGVTAATIAAILLGRQLQEERKRTTLLATQRQLELLQQPEVREARGKVLKARSDKILYESMSDGKDKEGMREAIELVCSTFDLAALFSEKRLIDRKLLIEASRPTVVKCWEFCKPLVEEQRNAYQHQDRWVSFQHLAEEAARVV